MGVRNNLDGNIKNVLFSSQGMKIHYIYVQSDNMRLVIVHVCLQYLILVYTAVLLRSIKYVVCHYYYYWLSDNVRSCRCRSSVCLSQKYD